MSPDVLVTGALGTRSAQGRGKAERSEPEKTAARLGELVAITSIAEKTVPPRRSGAGSDRLSVIRAGAPD